MAISLLFILFYCVSQASLGAQLVKLQCRIPWFHSWVRKIPRKRERLPTPVLGFLVAQTVKNPPTMWEAWVFDPWVGKIPWRRERLIFCILASRLPVGRDWVTCTWLEDSKILNRVLRSGNAFTLHCHAQSSPKCDRWDYHHHQVNKGQYRLEYLDSNRRQSESWVAQSHVYH